MLRTIKLGEADRIVTIFTQGHGKVRAVAKGIRKTDEQVRRPARADEPRRAPVLPGPRARHRDPGRDDRVEPGAARGVRAAHPRDPDARGRRPGRPGARAEPGAVPDAHRRAAHARATRRSRSSRPRSSGSCSRSRASTRCSTPAPAAASRATTATPCSSAFDLDEGGALCRPCAAAVGRPVVARGARRCCARMLGGGLNGALAEPPGPAAHEVEQLGDPRARAPRRAPPALHRAALRRLRRRSRQPGRRPRQGRRLA